jgi:ATP-dependent Clp protease adaptor protein ClpS
MTHEQVQYQESEATTYRKQQVLVLHNDSYNTFDFVIRTLIDECNHDLAQAEQCAIIAHHKGKCEILSGELFELQKIKNRISVRGLTVSIVEP